MASLNKVQLIGNLGRDPEVKSGRNGGEFVTMSLATAERWRDKSGETQERTEWHSIVLYAEPAVKYASKYLSKGDMVYIEGQLETREWEDKDGNTRKTTQVVVRPYSGQVIGLGGGSRRSRESEDSEPAPRGGAPRRPAYEDDEIPFAPEWR